MSSAADPDINLADPDAVYRELNRLSEEATRLFEQVIALKAQLESAVNTSTSAESTVTALFEQIEQLHAEIATTAANATAIVYGGNYSVDPAPGNVPIADASGRLKVEWMPGLTMNVVQLQSIAAQNQADIDSLEDRVRVIENS